jgi:uncharacterized protein
VIFIDTGAFLARYMGSDQYHHEAVEGWRSLAWAGNRYFTSNLVLTETFTLLGRRAGYGFAAERARRIYASELLTVLRAGPADERSALVLFEKYADQKVSFTDCVSFVLMRQHRLERAFTFDNHFALLGFRLVPAWEPAGMVSEPPARYG